MELTLPMNYVELEQEEMMYLDGGGVIKVTLTKTFLKAFVSMSATAVATYISLKYLANSSIARRVLTAAIISFVGAFIGNSINRDIVLSTGNIPLLPNITLRI